MRKPIEFQRRHFEFIADTVRDACVTNLQRAELADLFADRLHQTNAKFDRERFLLRCAVKEGEE